MFSARTQVNLWKIFIVLEIINYQIVTILFNDFFLLKFMRDILLMVIVAATLAKGRIKVSKMLLGVGALIVFLLIAAIRTDSLSVILTYFRKYLSPVIFLLAVINTDFTDEKMYTDLLKYMLNVLFVFSLWGIFQAYILGPSFLMKLGYPTKYSNVFHTMALKDSFYFGNLGIQRVVGTLSNANVCAVILGASLITFAFNYKKVITSKWQLCKLLCVMVAYLLTFSRANFLALIIVAIIAMWKYIPKKSIIVLIGIFLIGCFGIMYFIQDSDGITHKLVNWVVNSLQFKESSAAGRTGIWKTAFDGVMNHPLGLGFGHTGTGVPGHVKSPLFFCENSYLAIAIDLGIAGLLAFVFYGATIVAEIFRNRTDKRLFKMAITIIVYVAITYVFSNHVYDRELNIVVGLLIGSTIVTMRRGRT